MTWEGERGGFFFDLVYRWPYRDRIFKLIKFVIATHQKLKWGEGEVKVQKDLSLWARYGFFQFSD